MTEEEINQNQDIQDKTDDTSHEKPSVEEKKKKAGKPKKEESKLKKLQQKYDELNDKYIRLFSEFDNYRKRTLKERIEFSKTATEEIITALLPVLDDFERALQAFDKTDNTESIKEGINLIYNKFKSVLESRGLEQMKSHGEEFNTDYHDAITSIPAPSEDKKGKVVDEVEKGYLLNGKVIRYAKVVVGS